MLGYQPQVDLQTGIAEDDCTYEKSIGQNEKIMDEKLRLPLEKCTITGIHTPWASSM